MHIWTLWLDSIRNMLQFFAVDLGLGAGLSIVALTLLLRMAVLPVSWSCAYRGSVHSKRMRRLQPELQRIREKYAKQPQLLAEQTMATYRRHGLSIIEVRSVLGALLQTPVFLGMYQVLRQGVEGARFLWIANLAKPDFWIALIVGISASLMMAANPDVPEQTRMFMLIVPGIVMLLFALKFASAIGLYMVVSNGFTALQTVAVHYLIQRRIRSGAVSI